MPLPPVRSLWEIKTRSAGMRDPPGGSGAVGGVARDLCAALAPSAGGAAGTERVSILAASEANGDSNLSAVSADGGSVVFDSVATKPLALAFGERPLRL